ncbi:MAG: hypothetical protein KGJ09_03675 [Candidatus Omnitrophica bacterium]|nr:hypothetical protein [Candidatus Omnitrophota bacterium]MDE2213680.1 hypothetical protein [Candidatus Omnitrophota bacterium]MDE2230745.1 hypothetical protein [Candidatus Omnitrophota bacterium]
MLNKYIPIIIAFIGIFVWARPAFAERLVYQPYAETGEWEYETTGQYDFDHAKNKNAVQEYKNTIGYGVNSFWHTELELETEAVPTDEAISSVQTTHLEWENIFQLAPRGKYWLDPGIYLAYEAPVTHKQTGQFEAKILLEKDFQKVSDVLNISINKEAGGGADSHIDGGISWSTRYRLSRYFEPGFEYWNDFSAISHQIDYNQQSHQIGPCFYGHIFRHINYNIGYLFGISDAAPRGELKWIMEYEF